VSSLLFVLCHSHRLQLGVAILVIAAVRVSCVQEADLVVLDETCIGSSSDPDGDVAMDASDHDISFVWIVHRRPRVVLFVGDHHRHLETLSQQCSPCSQCGIAS
jgi:hypothetical protein